MKTGFDAMGKKVPAKRLQTAYEAIKEIAPKLPKETQFSIVQKAANFIERDQPFLLLVQFIHLTRIWQK